MLVIGFKGSPMILYAWQRLGSTLKICHFAAKRNLHRKFVEVTIKSERVVDTKENINTEIDKESVFNLRNFIVNSNLNYEDDL